MTIIDVSRALDLSWDEVRYIDQKYLFRKYMKPPWKKLRVIGVDEVALQKGHKYLTIVVNLKTGQIVYAGKDRTKETLITFFRGIGPTRCRRIKGIVMDMWSSYIAAATEYLPKAKLVFDRFHIISAYNKVLDIIRNYEYTNAQKEERGIIKGVRFLLLKNNEKLSENQKEKLDKLLEINKNLNLAYILKDDLSQLWDYNDKKEAEFHLDLWIHKAYNSAIPAIMSIAGTILKYKKGILNYFDMPITTGKVEGINNKIKVLKRKAYGFRNMEYFTLKLYDLHNLSAGFI
jgi:transposase